MLYLHGSDGLPQSAVTALHWLERAALRGDDEAAQLIAAHIPYEIARASPQAARLRVWYERAFDAGAAQAGLVFAQLVLALGASELADAGAATALFAKAIAALEMAANAGLPDAQWLLAQHGGHLAGIKDERGTTGVETATQVAGWTLRAADAGVAQARHALADQAWDKHDDPQFLHWAVPLARELVLQASQLPNSNPDTPRLAPEEAALLARCAQLLMANSHGDTADPKARGTQAEARDFLELAAQENNGAAQLALGLSFAKMTNLGQRVSGGAGSANFKKAIRWLTLAGEHGMADAWFVLSRIYLKSEFSQRSVPHAHAYLELAAQMGHAGAQFECGMNAWRRRRDEAGRDVRAAYWLQKAQAQGHAEAAALLEKVAGSAEPAAWAVAMHEHLTRDAIDEYPLLTARIELAAVFGLSRTEALMLDIAAADQGHCLVLDIRGVMGRGKRRLILLQTASERFIVNRVAQTFDGIDCSPSGPEGNYRQRLYRLKTVQSQQAA